MEGGEARIVAYTKVFAIRARLDKRVRYITDGEKTSLASSITYISNPEKTEQFFFTSVLNCSSVDTALSEMMETKQQFGKMGGVLGYHFIQSFQPGEVTPEQAHAVGLEFAKRLFGKRYEVVISTHLNKHHLHNHLVVNSVSCIDGQKYHSSPESYYNDVRGTSDALCRENDLSVITPQGKGKHYAEWKAEQGGKPTVRGIIRADIDTIIGQAYTYDSFLMLLRRNGYEVRRSPNRKYTTVKPPGAKRAIRLDSLGEGYTEADILLRLSRQRHGGMAPLIIAHTVKRYRMKGKLATVRKKKITGFHALYLRYLYLLRGGRRKKLPPKLPFSVKREVIHLERYEQQFKYLLSSGITTEAELEQRIRLLEWDIRLLEEQRKPLYQERRNTNDEEAQAKYSAEIQQQTAALREKRGELRLCRRIQSDIPRVPGVSAYPAEVRASEENGVYRLEKVYYLTAKDDPTTIPTADFEREGHTYTLLDLLKNDQTETDTREHIEVVTLESKTKDMAEILKMLEPKLEVKTEDGYEGVLSLDHTTIQVEAAGYGTSSRTVTAERTYPNLSDADVSLVPKSVNENGRTLTLADVSWQEAAVDPTDGYDIPIRYTAVASYTGTATSKYAIGYTVTADYKGDVTRTSCDTVVYTAVFSSVGNAAAKTGRSSFNWLWLLIPVGAAALGGCGYAGYKGYRHYINKKRGYAA